MSAWYIFPALGVYPTNPAGDEYVVDAPFFKAVTPRLPDGVAGVEPGVEEPALAASAPGALSKASVKGSSVNGREHLRPVLMNWDLVTARSIEFGMSDVFPEWRCDGI
jgi:putative alpha-1,2-mannosidase